MSVLLIHHAQIILQICIILRNDDDDLSYNVIVDLWKFARLPAPAAVHGRRDPGHKMSHVGVDIGKGVAAARFAGEAHNAELVVLSVLV
jgi:hypothetical protein